MGSSGQFGRPYLLETMRLLPVRLRDCGHSRIYSPRTEDEECSERIQSEGLGLL